MGFGDVIEGAWESLLRNLPFASEDKGHRSDQPPPAASAAPPVVIAPAKAAQPVDPVRRKKFVDPRVIELPVTTRIIDAIMPSYPEGTQVIAGYLNDAQQFWKVNYHWDYLLWMIEHSIGLGVSDMHKKCLEAVKASLLTNPPSPQRGYKDSDVGKPEDASSVETITARWKLMRQAKKDFKSIVVAADLKSLSKRKPACFDLAAAPVAQPGTSKHGSGYALDIKGSNAKISEISRKIGASLVFDEQSHVHVEFAKGVKA